MTPTLALAGNPNTGKTSLFNELTGAHQHVGNWPGKTVEQQSGEFEWDGHRFEVIDLPGTYGLLAVSAEEEIAAGFLVDGPDAVITVVDAANLERSLHLVAQIAELGLRQVVACNMSDVAERRGSEIDRAELARAFGVDVVRTVARRGDGVAEIRRAVAEAMAKPEVQPMVVDYGPVLERHLSRLIAEIVDTAAVAAVAPARWVAVQLVAGDGALADRIAALDGGPAVLEAAEQAREGIASDTGVDAGLAIAERRYRWVHEVVGQVEGGTGRGSVWSERIDRVVAHRWMGLPVFLAVMWLVLKITTDVTAPFLDWVDAVVSGPMARWASAGLGAAGLGGGWVEGLVVDGMLAGVGGVLVFVPVLFGLYLTLAILEDSGYMARAALVMDRAMRVIGIPGKAFLPMMVGFGCTVPAIYATRTLDSRRDRLLTGLMVPFMSCGARLPVYVLLGSIFFVDSSGSVVFAMYLLGIGVAVIVGLALGRTLLRDEDPAPFVMVLPDYRLPSPRTVWALVKRRTLAFIEGAGTMILVASIAVWVLLAIPIRGGGFGDTRVEDSAFGTVAGAVAPVMDPLGLGEWEQTGALMSGFVAKEVVVSTMSQVYGGADAAGEEPAQGLLGDLAEIGSGFVDAAVGTLRAIPGIVGLDFTEVADAPPPAVDERIRESFESSSGGHGALAALAFMVFVLLYTPCVAAVAAFKHEFGTRWMLVSVLGQLGIAWLVSCLVYQGGRMLGFG
ncbi:MAG: ferrous iron transport protein B [Actinobacteria bacterium]|nr:ferrous iron transport protein B [Actinomycetota bacterium]